MYQIDCVRYPAEKFLAYARLCLMRAVGGGLLCNFPEKRPHLAHARIVPRGNYQVSRLSRDCRANSLLPSLPVTRSIPSLMAYLRGADLEYGAASLPDVQRQAPPRLTTHS